STQGYSSAAADVYKRQIRDSGTGIADILPPMGLFGNAGARRAEKKKRVIKRLKDFFDRFYDISGGKILVDL
ncbi:MAG: hypothetical protein K2K08_00880, partial [Paramuribaculum sp.]|nr:hypothetical protein [Paramuribaculum sp.]